MSQAPSLNRPAPLTLGQLGALAVDYSTRWHEEAERLRRAGIDPVHMRVQANLQLPLHLRHPRANTDFQSPPTASASTTRLEFPGMSGGQATGADGPSTDPAFEFRLDLARESLLLQHFVKARQPQAGEALKRLAADLPVGAEIDAAYGQLLEPLQASGLPPAVAKVFVQGLLAWHLARRMPSTPHSVRLIAQLETLLPRLGPESDESPWVLLAVRALARSVPGPDPVQARIEEYRRSFALLDRGGPMLDAAVQAAARSEGGVSVGSPQWTALESELENLVRRCTYFGQFSIKPIVWTADAQFALNAALHEWLERRLLENKAPVKLRDAMLEALDARVKTLIDKKFGTTRKILDPGFHDVPDTCPFRLGDLNAHLRSVLRVNNSPELDLPQQAEAMSNALEAAFGHHRQTRGMAVAAKAVADRVGASLKLSPVEWQLFWLVYGRFIEAKPS